jgi:hypothetical protein
MKMFPILASAFLATIHVGMMAQSRPSQIQLDATLGRIFPCKLFTNGSNLSANDAKVFEYLSAIENKKQQSGKPDTGIDFTLDGVRLKLTGSYAGPGGAVVVFYAPRASVDQLRQLLMNQGWALTLQPLKIESSVELAWQSILMDSADTTTLAIRPGKLSLTVGESDPKAAGVTVVCSQSSTSADAWQMKDGLPTRDQMLVLEQKGEPYPSNWIEPIITKGSYDARRSISARATLSAEQVARLWRDPSLRDALASGQIAQLTVSQLRELLAADQSGIVTRLIVDNLPRLPKQFVTELEQLPRYARMLAVARREPGTLKDLVAALKKGDDAAIGRFIALYQQYDDAVVDAIFTHGGKRWKMEAADRRKDKFNAEQIERALTDPDRDVQIWMLRRKDIELTPAQYDRGINGKNTDVAFWYQQYKGQVPTTAQVDQGLASSSEPTRWSWATREDVTLTQSQITKILQDPVPRVKYAIWRRKEWKPSDAQIDQCFVEQQGFDARVCFSRADFEVNPRWFEQIARNWNRNVMQEWRDHPRFSRDRHEDLLVDLAGRADDRLLKVLMDSNDLMFTAAHAVKFSSKVSPAVKTQFCKRVKPTC